MRNSTLLSLVSDSGATYSILVFPFRMSSLTLNISFLLSEELRKWATPSAAEKERMASTWFFIRAIRGEITMAVPSNSSAGN